MDLHVTHHALERLAFVRMSHLSLVPHKTSDRLTKVGVDNLYKALKIIMLGLSHSKRALLPAKVMAFKEAKYGLGDIWMYDPTQGTLFTLRPNHPGYGIALVTIVHLTRQNRRQLENYPDDADPAPDIKGITRIWVPYDILNASLAVALPHPLGGTIEVRFGVVKGDPNVDLRESKDHARPPEDGGHVDGHP